MLVAGHACVCLFAVTCCRAVKRVVPRSPQGWDGELLFRRRGKRCVKGKSEQLHAKKA